MFTSFGISFEVPVRGFVTAVTDNPEVTDLQLPVQHDQAIRKKFKAALSFRLILGLENTSRA